MKSFKWLLTLFLPSFIFCCTEIEYTTVFAENFRGRDFEKCLEILDEWERTGPSCIGEILGMKAAIYLSLGDLEKSKDFMDRSLECLDSEKFRDSFFSRVIQMYYKALGMGQEAASFFNGLMLSSVDDPSKFTQPKGVKLRFWFAVGQMLSGLLIAPINPAVGGSLIFSGAVSFVDVAADAIDNKDEWEKGLNERQRINPNINQGSLFRWREGKDPSFGMVKI